MFIIVISGTNVGSVYALDKTDYTIIGRGQECDIRVLDLLVSRRHCQIEWKRNGFYIKDLHSTNKTYLNKKIIEVEQKLEPGDTLNIGNSILLFTDKEEVPIKNIEEYNLMRMSQTRNIDSQSGKDKIREF